MILPIVSSISRELFLGVPRELKEGALALGTTRWEMVRGVMFPYARGGIAAALILGLGRAVGEAIAVTQVIGGGVFIHWNLFGGRRHARLEDRRVVPGRDDASSRSRSLIYLGLILLVFSLVDERRRAGGSSRRVAADAGAAATAERRHEHARHHARRHAARSNLPRRRARQPR